jgi:CRISPR-associated endonuclease Cas2
VGWASIPPRFPFCPDKLAAPLCQRRLLQNAGMDKSRTLYLVAYDICEPRRLHRICRYLTGYKVAGQKSVFEIWVTPAELARIRADLERMMDTDEDRLHILVLDPRMKPRCFGRAQIFQTQHFAIL